LRVAVIGGGVVGLCCAYELMHAGADVTVVERDRCGRATSFGNAGWVVPSLSIPMPAPGITAQALKMILKSNGSLRIRPRLDPDFLRWCWRFWRNSTQERYKAGLKALFKLNEQTIQLYKDLHVSGIEFEMHESGLLIATLSEETLEEYVELLEVAKAAGYAGEVELLGKEALLRVEPALSDAVVGAVHAKDDLHVRPDTLGSGLVSYLVARDVQILEDTEVYGFEPAGKGGWLVSTSREKLSADRVVVAAGMWSSELLGKLGVRIPLEAGKGYSVTASGRGTKPRHALKLAEPNVACSPFKDAVRISGIFELGGRDLSVNRRLLEGVLRSASVFLRDWVMDEPRFEWAGMRPTTPDDLPLIGAVPGLEHLYVATGHGMLGVTLGPATGAAMVPLVLENRMPSVLEPFRVDRFAPYRGRALKEVPKKASEIIG
jgi:D-amino-acid dehydrogenase